MDYEQALKKVRAEKPKENLMVFEFAYSNKFLLPHSDGVALLNALSKAERLADGYSEPGRIVPVRQEDVRSFLFSSQQYEQYKMAGILNIRVSEVEEMMAAQNKPKPDTP